MKKRIVYFYLSIFVGILVGLLSLYLLKNQYDIQIKSALYDNYPAFAHGWVNVFYGAFLIIASLVSVILGYLFVENFIEKKYSLIIGFFFSFSFPYLPICVLFLLGIR